MASPSNTKPPRPSSDRVDRAVKALLKWRKDQSQTENPNPKLLEDDDDEFVYLVITLKKAPPKNRADPFQIRLPHSLHAADSSETCLIIADGTRSGLNKDLAEKKIKSENVPISKVLKVTELKSDFKSFEAKRKLHDSFDLFLADKRIVPLIPKFLGKVFAKKKVPIPVDLKNGNWREEIESALGSAILYLKTGTCSVVRVARTSMEREEIMENVMAAIAGVAEVVPRKWSNVRSFHVKLLESLALPVYQSDSDAKSKIEGSEGSEKVEEAGKKKVLKKRRI